MSTKSTVAHGSTFHLYHEAHDDDYLYLELKGVPFEASPKRVLVPIPVHIWEVIRRYPGVDLRFAEQNDDQLRQYVEQRVDERIARYRDGGGHAQSVLRFAGAGVYGTADTPREQQTADGMTYFTKLREHQRQIKQAIAELEQLNQARM